MTCVIAEVPAVLHSGWSMYPYYQYVHRQHTVAGFVDESFGDPISLQHPGLRLRNCVAVKDPKALRRRGVEYVVVHRDVAREWSWTSRRAPPDTAALIAVLVKEYGPAVYEDALVSVFKTSGGSNQGKQESGG